jgi:large subunit ribosomal protein L10
MAKKKQIKAHVSQEKLKLVDELADLMTKKKTIMIVSIKGFPSSQLQSIRNKLRKKATVKIAKKNIVIRAIDKTEKGSLMNLKPFVEDGTALLFSDAEAFELAAELAENTIPAKARPGQIAPEEIIAEAGQTELVPGPVISEFGRFGIQIEVKDGKIAIRKNKAILKAGEVVTDDAASLMAKLEIVPFRMGLEAVAAYSAVTDKIYEHIKIDKKGTLEQLKVMFSKALGFALSIGYVCSDTIKLLIGKAGMQEKALSKLIKTEVKENKDNQDKIQEG